MIGAGLTLRLANSLQNCNRSKRKLLRAKPPHTFLKDILFFCRDIRLRRGVAAWRVASRVAPARSAPCKVGALRAILVKSARYARSQYNLVLRRATRTSALRASQHCLTEVSVFLRGWLKGTHTDTLQRSRHTITYNLNTVTHTPNPTEQRGSAGRRNQARQTHAAREAFRTRPIRRERAREHTSARKTVL